MRWLFLIVAGCGRFGFTDRTGGDDSNPPTVDAAITSDMQMQDAAITLPPPCDLAKPFGAPQIIAGINGIGNDGTLRLSSDELTGYFWSDRGAAGNADIYRADRVDTSSAFTVTAEPQLNSTAAEYEVSPIVAGTQLIVRSDRAGGLGGADLYVAQRANTSADWTLALAGNVNGTANEVQPYVPTNRDEMYLVSNRSGHYAIYRSSRTGTTFGAPALVAELDDGSNSQDPVASADGLTIYFRSDRTGSIGQFDIWVATRTATTLPFGAPTRVAELSSTADEGCNWISDDGCRMYMSSTRLGNVDLFLATKPQ
jgi:WD40-like Beta Propeller Repeat